MVTQTTCEETDGQFLLIVTSPFLSEILKSVCDTYRVSTDTSLSNELKEIPHKTQLPLKERFSLSDTSKHT